MLLIGWSFFSKSTNQSRGRQDNQKWDCLELLSTQLWTITDKKKKLWTMNHYKSLWNQLFLAINFALE